jgi:hypothetical protein
VRALPRAGRILAGALAVLAVAACRADARINVTITSSGAGTVAATLVLDRQAVAVVGDRVDVSDLRQQGWSVTGPAKHADGSESITVAHDFRDAAEGTALLAHLGQPVQLTVIGSRGSLSSTVGLGGAVDLTGGPDALAGQVPNLPGGAAGALAAIAREGGTLPAFSVQVVAMLPGKPRTVVGRGRVSGATVTWDAPMGSRTTLGAKFRQTDAVAKRWLIGAAVLAVAFVAVVVVEAVVTSRRRGAHAETGGHRIDAESVPTDSGEVTAEE